MPEQSLMVYVPKGPMPLKILTVESSKYIPALREHLPNAEIFAAAVEVDDFAPYKRYGATVVVCDYRRGPLPFPDKTFDVIIAEECLTWAFEPYETIMDISRKLTDTGFVVAMFYNARCHKILRELSMGRFNVDGRHFWTKNDIVKIFNDAVFKEIDFTYAEKDNADVSAFVELGFDNFNDDLNTKSHIIKAARSKASVAALKSLYTPGVRRRLATLLHRAEYDVRREESLSELKELCRREFIFPEYLRDFVHEVCIHEEIVSELLP